VQLILTIRKNGVDLLSLKFKGLLLKIDSSGIATEIKMDTDEINDDNILFLIDEVNYKNWLYIGSNTSFIHKRGAMRVANSLKKFGYELNGSIIGRKCTDLEIIDKTSDQTKQDKEEIFYSLFKKSEIKFEELEVKKPSAVSSNVFTKNNVLIRPVSEALVNNITQSEPEFTSIDKEITPDKEKGYEGVNKFGVLVTSILQEFPEIRISKSSKDENEYVVESPDGPVCQLKIDSDKLVISSNSTFGDDDKKIKIQQKFIHLSKKLPDL
jgi:hypothetical protein